MFFRKAYLITLDHFKLRQADISRRTEELEKMGVGIRVSSEQLNRYLKGHRDLMGEGIESIVYALPDVPRAFYMSMLLAGKSYDSNQSQSKK